ncbi:hypothetical protein EON63_16620, partial [archaeon]
SYPHTLPSPLPGRAANIKNCELCARKIAEVAQGDKIVVEKSTVPVRTAESIKKVLACSSQHKFQVLSNPEFLAEGEVYGRWIWKWYVIGVCGGVWCRMMCV